MSANPQSSPPRLELKGLAFVRHYMLPLSLLGPSVVFVLCELTVGPPANSAVSVMCLITLSGAGLIGWNQARSLQFRLIKTSSEAHDNYSRVLDAIHKQPDWKVRSHRADSLIVATVLGVQTIRVEVRFHGGDTFVNSICDPSRLLPGVISWGRKKAIARYISSALADI